MNLSSISKHEYDDVINPPSKKVTSDNASSKDNRQHRDRLPTSHAYVNNNGELQELKDSTSVLYASAKALEFDKINTEGDKKTSEQNYEPLGNRDPSHRYERYSGPNAEKFHDDYYLKIITSEKKI